MLSIVIVISANPIETARSPEKTYPKSGVSAIPPRGQRVNRHITTKLRRGKASVQLASMSRQNFSQRDDCILRQEFYSSLVHENF